MKGETFFALEGKVFSEFGAIALMVYTCNKKLGKINISGYAFEIFLRSQVKRNYDICIAK